MAKYDPNQVQTLRLAEIDADFNWNARRGLDEQTDTSGTAGYSDILVNIAKEGQKTPVVVRPHPKAGQTIRGRKMPAFFLCSGFQRFRAIMEIAAGESSTSDMLGKAGVLPSQITALKSDAPTIRAFVRDLSDEAARDENITENVLRCALTAPDVAFGIADLFKINPTLTIDKVASKLGISPAYCGVLYRTYTGIKDVVVPAGHPANPSKSKDMPLMEVWRAEKLKPKKDDMLSKVAELKVGKGAEATTASADEKLAAYATLTDRGVAKPDKHETRGKEWHENAIAVYGPQVGLLLGKLCRDGGIEMLGIDGKHVAAVLESVGKKIPTKEDDKLDAKLDAVAVAVMKGYHKGLQPEPEPVVTGNASSTAKQDKAQRAEAASAHESDGIPEGGTVAKKAKKGAKSNGRAHA
jgi:hypothetical protein